MDSALCKDIASPGEFIMAAMTYLSLALALASVSLSGNGSESFSAIFLIFDLDTVSALPNAGPIGVALV